MSDMTIGSAIIEEAQGDQTLYIFLGIVLTAGLVGVLAPSQRRHLQALVWLFAIHVLLVPTASMARVFEPSIYPEVRLAALAFAAFAIITMVLVMVMNVTLFRLKFNTPRILRDVLFATTSGIAFFSIASRLGFNLSGLIATSAVLTAVIGFSLQDTLGNIIGGLALQMDNSIGVNDWLKVGEHSGKVTEIRWRYAALETRNGETIIIPNSILMKSQVSVLGRRTNNQVKWRRWIWFNVDFRFPPSDVIMVVEEMLRNAVIEGVATDPAPECLFMGIEESYARYAVRYWLTNLSRTDSTDSVVRTRLYFALQRAKIPLSIPAYAVFETKETTDRRTEKSRIDFDRRIKALSEVALFRSTTPEERAQLAENLRYAPFTGGEIITKQGSEAHWLYLLVAGEVSIRVAGVTGRDGRAREVEHLTAPEVFGEMSLMTGQKREATVIALGDVECYRLERNSFQKIISLRPEIAESCAALLAQRMASLIAVKEDLDHEAQLRREAVERVSILASIRSFFGLSENARK